MWMWMKKRKGDCTADIFEVFISSVPSTDNPIHWHGLWCDTFPSLLGVEYTWIM